MLARMRSGIGGVTAIVIVVMAMWMWTRSAELSAVLAMQPLHPLWELWAVRCAALAAAVGAQWLLLTGVVCAFYEERTVDQIVRTVVGLIGSMAMIAALLLAFLGR